ncbi:MAG TPA: hypothetical protein PLJ35_05395 [Anaerolineae bacterium]|nr:hypothetical protein [Anaerolineae bacterium]
MTDDPTTDADSTEEAAIPPEAWQEAVWKAHCKGNRNITNLCRISEATGGPKRWHTIRDFVDKRKRDLALALQPEAERADYEAGLESDLEDADAIYNRAVAENNVNGQIGALRAKMEARKCLANSRGVVTERSQVGLHGVAGEAPVALAWWQGIEQAQKGADDGGGEGE